MEVVTATTPIFLDIEFLSRSEYSSARNKIEQLLVADCPVYWDDLKNPLKNRTQQLLRLCDEIVVATTIHPPTRTDLQAKLFPLPSEGVEAAIDKICKQAWLHLACIVQFSQYDEKRFLLRQDDGSNKLKLLEAFNELPLISAERVKAECIEQWEQTLPELLEQWFAACSTSEKLFCANTQRWQAESDIYDIEKAIMDKLAEPVHELAESHRFPYSLTLERRPDPAAVIAETLKGKVKACFDKLEETGRKELVEEFRATFGSNHDTELPLTDHQRFDSLRAQLSEIDLLMFQAEITNRRNASSIKQ